MLNQNLDGADNTIGNDAVAASVGQPTDASTLPVENQKTPTGSVGQTETLPETVSTRTKEQFEKLLERNRSLSEELRKYQASVPDVSSTNSATNVVATTYVDPEGNVDIERLNTDLKSAVNLSKQAYELAQKQREEAEEREAYARHPWLDPNSGSFNKDAYEAVVDRIVRKKFIGKENVTLLTIADEVARFYKPDQVTPQQAVEQYKLTEQQKNIVAPINSGKGESASRSSYDQEDLRKRTQEGDPEAIRERLKRLGILK